MEDMTTDKAFDIAMKCLKNAKAREENLKQLVERCVELEVELAQKSVPDGCCPYRFFDVGDDDTSCDDCVQCQISFYKKVEEQARERYESFLKTETNE